MLFLVAELVRNCGRFTLADVRRRADERAAGADRGGNFLGHRVRSLPGGADGGRGQPGRAAARRARARRRAVLDGDRRRRAHGDLRVVGRDAGHHLDPDRQGGPADRRDRSRSPCWSWCASTATSTHLLRSAAERSGHGEAFLAPGLKYGGDWTARLDFISLGLALVLGTAGLPHILSRFYTVPTARAARRSVVWSIGLIGGFYLMTIVLGFGAAAIVGSDAVRGSNAAGNTAVPLLALDLGGGAGLHGRNGAVRDRRRHRLRHDPRRRRRHHPRLLGLRGPRPVRLAAAPARPKPRSEVAVARVAAVGIGVVAIALGLLAQRPQRRLPGGPRLRGRRVRESAGAALLAVLAAASPPGARSGRSTAGWCPPCCSCCCRRWCPGSPESLFPGVDFQYFPLQNPGLVSIPLGFLAGWLGTVTSAEAAGRGQARGDRGAVAHRRGGGVSGAGRVTRRRARRVERSRAGECRLSGVDPRVAVLRAAGVAVLEGEAEPAGRSR